MIPEPFQEIARIRFGIPSAALPDRAGGAGDAAPSRSKRSGKHCGTPDGARTKDGRLEAAGRRET